MESKHVLVVDDDSMIRNCIAEILSMEGYSVYCAVHGKDALDQLVSMRQEELPGCIILDLKMPVMDGTTFLQSIQKEYADSLGLIPVIVSSANGNLNSLPNLESAVERWDKPVNLDNLFRVANKYCGAPTGTYLH